MSSECVSSMICDQPEVGNSGIKNRDVVFTEGNFSGATPTKYPKVTEAPTLDLGPRGAS